MTDTGSSLRRCTFVYAPAGIIRLQGSPWNSLWVGFETDRPFQQISSTALADSRRQRIIALCGLHVAQGVPWGFMLITLPAYLAYHHNVGDEEIEKLTAVILVPWSFKLIWAPLMDTFTIRSMGRRRPWIIGAEFMMAVTLLGFVGLGDLSQELQWILSMYFVHNCFASLQNVCTDALAVDILPWAEQGQMNGLMWGSKLVGKGIGAHGLSLILNSWRLQGCGVVQVVILLGIMLIPMFVLEREGEKRFPWSAGRAAVAADSGNVRNLREVFRTFVRVLAHDHPGLGRLHTDQSDRRGDQ